MPVQPDTHQTWWSERPSESRGAPVVVGDRWVLGAVLGRGGFGRVVAAEDRVTGEAVAVKLIARVSPGMRQRLSRELAALRRLDHPGVVRFLADLPVGEGHGIVMERLPGAVFPGEVASDWTAMRPVVLALFRALAHIHDHGIIHRDLKPSNVLMRDRQPVLLDFGLARGPELGTTITRSGARLGTLRYMSPEQGAGERVTPKTDLYSAGLMVYQALTGRMPHPGEGGEALVRARLTRPPTPIRDHRPDLPAEVASTLDALLCRDPAQRPSDAHAVLALLDGTVPPELPWLGDRALLERTLSRLDRGESMSISGPTGSGRSRLLQEVAARRPHHWLRPGTRPYESLGELIDGVDLSTAGSRAEARAWVQQALLQRAGMVLLVDEVALDWSTRKLLEEHPGPVLRVSPAAPSDSGNTICLSVLPEHSLRSLFEGPDRVLHLREDAAAELHRRTDGHPSQVVRELAAWQRAGLAHSTDGGLRVERATLDRLRAEQPARSRASSRAESTQMLPAHLERVCQAVQVAGRHSTPAFLGALTELSGWQLEEALHELQERGLVRSGPDRLELVEAVSTAGWTPDERAALHARLAAALPEGSDERLHHMLEGAVREGLVAEALSTCRLLERAGRVADARAWLERVCRSAVDEEGLRPVLEAHMRLALDAADAAVAREAAELVRQSPRAAGEGLQTVAEAIEALGRDEAARAQELLGALPPFADRHLEAQRIRHLQMKADRLATGSDRATLQAAMAEDWPAPWPAVWAALWAYRQSDLRAAATALEAAAECEARVAHRVRDRLRAASAWSMVGELDRTLALAQTGLEESRQRRLAGLELQAEWIQRMVAQKRGATEVDWELVRAAERLAPMTDRAGLVVLTESYIAFQGGDSAAMTTLARRALRLLESSRLDDGVQMATGLVAAGESRWDDLRALCAAGSPVARADLLSLLKYFDEATVADCQQLRSVAGSLSEAGLDRVGLFKLASVL